MSFACVHAYRLCSFHDCYMSHDILHLSKTFKTFLKLMENIKAQALSFHKKVDENLSQYPILNQIEKQYGVPKAYVAEGIMALSALLLVLDIAGKFLSNLIGLIYPGNKSLKAIKSSATEDDTKWLTYWVVYATFATVESFTDLLINWVPFYYTAKVLFLLYLSLPQFDGAVKVYQIIEPFLTKEGSKMDAALDKLKNATEKKNE
eukprot:NODE_1044_length_1788_cov_0.240379.p1 type:complete len:205 gc:universal NODE_1044_length_1788_cov_0.240379:1396-782(-)